MKHYSVMRLALILGLRRAFYGVRLYASAALILAFLAAMPIALKMAGYVQHSPTPARPVAYVRASCSAGWISRNAVESLQYNPVLGGILEAYETRLKLERGSSSIEVPLGVGLYHGNTASSGDTLSILYERYGLNRTLLKHLFSQHGAFMLLLYDSSYSEPPWRSGPASASFPGGFSALFQVEVLRLNRPLDSGIVAVFNADRLAGEGVRLEPNTIYIVLADPERSLDAVRGIADALNDSCFSLKIEVKASDVLELEKAETGARRFMLGLYRVSPILAGIAAFILNLYVLLERVDELRMLLTYSWGMPEVIVYGLAQGLGTGLPGALVSTISLILDAGDAWQAVIPASYLLLSPMLASATATLQGLRGGDGRWA